MIQRPLKTDHRMERIGVPECDRLVAWHHDLPPVHDPQPRRRRYRRSTARRRERRRPSLRGQASSSPGGTAGHALRSSARAVLPPMARPVNRVAPRRHRPTRLTSPFRSSVRGGPGVEPPTALDRQRLPGELVDHVEQVQQAAVGRLIELEIQRPDVRAARPAAAPPARSTCPAAGACATVRLRG